MRKIVGVLESFGGPRVLAAYIAVFWGMREMQRHHNFLAQTIVTAGYEKVAETPGPALEHPTAAESREAA